MKYCYIVSAFVIIVLTISVVGGKHKGRRSKDHSRHKHMRLLTQAKHFRRPKNHGILTYSDHRHQRGHRRPPGLKCRRIKFIVNRNVHLKKKTTAALKRQMTNKHTRSILHRVTTNKSSREAKLFEDRQGNLVTYIEDCVASENAEKKNFFESQRELYIEPIYGKKKTQRHSTHPSSKDDDISTVQSSEDEISDDKILPATEDSLLQTVSDSSEILKDDGQDMKEGTAQLFKGQHETEVASNFGTVFQAARTDSPLPKKPEEGSELQRYFSSAGVTSMARINSDVVAPDSQQPLNLDRQNGDQLPLHMPNAGFVSGPPRETQAEFVSELSEDYGNPLRDPEETHAKPTQNNGGYQVKTFSEAYDRLHNAEAQELAGFTNEALVPQSLGEAMSVEKAEANYEKNYETLYGKDKSIRLQKGAAYLPEKDNN
ncbi:uncharacterized protein LOC111326669 isoform X1 [Stylophora pistillata]|uniref:Uncharacterized protein n=1 Tax=Stylophora pistillata TaxID=50429 RepID=A0A2B4SHU5_STYPI|nr:uncharacterized protein LOC111326669 isoform X1 [Stylophora pistillata]PFX28107.1 hypothetical protein AWC38_SpisGene7162 [Stylophora pistillata]